MASIKTALVAIAYFLLILLFTYTGIMKLIDHRLFVATMHRSSILSAYASFLSWFVPILELLIVVALVHPKLRQRGFLSSFALMLFFTIYVGYMLATKSHLPCTCGGVIRYMNWHQHLYFNTFFTLLAAVATWLNGQMRIQEKQTQTTLPYAA